MASDPNINLGTIKTDAIKWLLHQGPGLVLLSAILYWLSQNAPQLLKDMATRYETLVKEEARKHETHSEKMVTELREGVKEDKAERKALALEHVKAADKFIETLSQQNSTFGKALTENSKAIYENSKATAELTAEVKKNRLLFPREKVNAEKAGGAPGG